jgi:membrane protein required for colicin V production
MMGSWNWLDWILIAVVLFSLLAGVRKGFTRELISLASLLVGLAVAAAEYQRASAWVERFVHSRELALAVAFLSLFGGILVAGALISALARKLLREAGIEGADRFLGAIFGLVRGVVVDAVVLMTLVAFALQTVAVQRSRLAPYVAVGSRGIAGLMPSDLRAKFQTGFDEFEREVVQNERHALEERSLER